MDKDDILGESAFKSTIYNRFQGIILNVLQGVSYHKLIDDRKYVTEVQKSVLSNVGSFLEQSGFFMLYCDIKPTPLDPKSIGVDPQIVEMWDMWEYNLLKNRQEKTLKQKELEEVGKRQACELKEATEKVIRESEIRELRALKEDEKEKTEIEKEQEQIKQDGRVATAKIRAAAENFFQERQEAELKFKDAVEQTESKLKQGRQEKELEFKNTIAQKQLEDEISLERTRLEQKKQKALDELKVKEELDTLRQEKERERAREKAKFKSEIRQQELKERVKKPNSNQKFDNKNYRMLAKNMNCTK
jgi:hypothetical protein